MMDATKRPTPYALNVTRSQSPRSMRSRFKTIPLLVAMMAAVTLWTGCEDTVNPFV